MHLIFQSWRGVQKRIIFAILVAMMYHPLKMSCDDRISHKNYTFTNSSILMISLLLANSLKNKTKKSLECVLNIVSLFSISVYCVKTENQGRQHATTPIVCLQKSQVNHKSNK